MRISDWSSDVCSADLVLLGQPAEDHPAIEVEHVGGTQHHSAGRQQRDPGVGLEGADQHQELADEAAGARQADRGQRSEEHTSELQSLMRISYAVFCLKKKIQKHITTKTKAAIATQNNTQ